MNFRISFVLVFLAAIVGGYVLLFELQQGPQREPDPPWFYNVHENDINHISVTYQGATQAFVKRETNWFFDDGTGEPGESVDVSRWGGIPLLLTGPRSRRLLEEQIDNPAFFGLDPPVTSIGITLRDGRQLNVLLGDSTPDGAGNYVQLEGDAPLFIVDITWGGVLNRLVTEPPVLATVPPVLAATAEAEAPEAQ